MNCATAHRLQFNSWSEARNHGEANSWSEARNHLKQGGGLLLPSLPPPCHSERSEAESNCEAAPKVESRWDSVVLRITRSLRHFVPWFCSHAHKTSTSFHSAQDDTRGYLPPKSLKLSYSKAGGASPSPTGRRGRRPLQK